MQKQAISPPPLQKKSKKKIKKKNHRSSSLAHFQTELSSIHTLILMFGPQAQKRPEMKSWKQYRMHEWDYTLHPRYMQHKMMQKRWEGGKKNHKECTRISVWRSRSSGLGKKTYARDFGTTSGQKNRRVWSIGGCNPTKQRAAATCNS